MIFPGDAGPHPRLPSFNQSFWHCTIIIRAFTIVIPHGAVITGTGFAGINLAGGFHSGSSPI
jgi:hypothetical protein